jgi:putative glycosyltransferase (TIGR04372 family)
MKPMEFSLISRIASKGREFWRHPRRVPAMLIYLPLALILKAAKVRILQVSHPGRIGHFALEVDWFLKKQALGDFGAVRPILFLRHDWKAPNETLIAVWARYLPVVSNPILRVLVYPLTLFRMLKLDLQPATLTTPAEYKKLSGIWDDRPPFLTLTEDIRERGERNLRAMGLPPGAWFACVHARENLNKFSATDERINTLRNCDIANYEKAVDEIIARGGWCLRMGEPDAMVLKPRVGVVNYHATPFKSDWMDIFLCANARFFLGNTSGICHVSAAAGRPCALANMIPHGECYGYGARDISIVKYLRDSTGCIMRFDGIFKSEVSTMRYESIINVEGLSVVDNSPQEIRDLVVEMLDMLDGRIEYTKEDEDLQAAFRSLLDHRHYAYFAKGRIGRDFLRQNAHLLGPDTTVSLADKGKARGVVS